MIPYPTFDGYTRKLFTLTMILKENEILLGMKNRGLGEGKWNGFGGKVEPNETIDDCAKREVKEESGLNVISMNKIGVLEFEFDGSKELLEVHLYTCKQFSGNIIESDEMAPIKWFKIKDTPYDSMWVEHKYWYPIMLKHIPFKGYFKHQNDNTNTMLDHNIKLLNSSEKLRQQWVNIVIKNNTQILLNINNKKWNYLSKFHIQVKNGETVENAALQCLKNQEISFKQLQKIAVVNIELIDESYISEINVFVMDISNLTKVPSFEDTRWLEISNIPKENLWPDNTFLSTLMLMKPFKAYFLNDRNEILFSKYYSN